MPCWDNQIDRTGLTYDLLFRTCKNWKFTSEFIKIALKVACFIQLQLWRFKCLVSGVLLLSLANAATASIKCKECGTDHNSNDDENERPIVMISLVNAYNFLGWPARRRTLEFIRSELFLSNFKLSTHTAECRYCRKRGMCSLNSLSWLTAGLLLSYLRTSSLSFDENSKVKEYFSISVILVGLRWSYFAFVLSLTNLA